MIRQLFVTLYVSAAVALAPALFAANAVQIENARQGTEDWKLFRSSDNQEIEGYASATSVANGESISFYVSSIESTYSMQIFRMGWYGGLGARAVHGPITRDGFQQAIPQPDPATGMVECNWTSPYTLTIPSDWVSGVYLVKLTLPSSRRNSYIPFIVRNDSSQANHYVQLSVDTWQAYNRWGGKSLYSKFSTNGVAADIVSFDRPYTDGNGTGQFLWNWEYSMIRFLEREGFDVTYSTNIDTHARGSLLNNHKSFLSIGHDEYWSWEMRQTVEAALASGVDLGFFTANAAYWQVRFAPNPAGVPYRRMIGYKEDAFQAGKDPYATDSDPSNNHLITVQFRDVRAANKPEAALIGVQYGDDPIDGDLVIDDVTSAPWVFTGTGLTKGSVLRGLLGYEVDWVVPGVTPAGTVTLAHSAFVTTDNGTTGFSDMVVRSIGTSMPADERPTVFATGTIQWPWGLDDWNSSTRGSRLNAAAQQITRNVLRRFAGSAAAPNDCLFTLAAPSATMSADPGTGSVVMTTAGTCSWTASSSASWLTLTSATSGSGSTTITYSVTKNSGASRTAHITIADKTYTVTQRGCTYALTPAGESVDSGGGTVTVTVATDSTCPWTAVSQASWITVGTASATSGNGTVTLTVAATSGPERTGTVTIGGTLFSVSQLSGCTLSFDPLYPYVQGGGGSGSVAVTASSSECTWSVTTPNSWITITSGTTGSGSGTITYTVAPNYGSGRDGELRINGRRYDIRQAAGSANFMATAAATSTTTVTVSWAGVGGATSYQVLRGTTIGSLSPIASTSATWLNDSGLQAGQAYVYRVFAYNGTTVIATSNFDPATLVAFTDPTIVPRVTRIKAVHQTELRQAVNALRAAAGLAAYSFGSTGSGAPISAMNLLQLRAAVNEARATLGLPAFTYTNPALAAGSPVSAADIQNIRAAVQ